MSTLKVDTIQKADGSGSLSVPADTGSLVTTAAGSVESAMTTQIGGRRNLIINGAMQVAQRGTSFAAISNGSFGLDRFKYIQAGTMATTVSQSTDAPSGFASSLKYQTTTAQASLGATDRLEARYAIEAQDLQHLDYGLSTAKATTLSFWVKSNKTGTYCVWVYAQDNTRSISKSYTINTADTWEYKTITIEGDTSGGITNDNGIGVWLSFFLGAGSTLQSGTQATNWESYALANIAVDQTVNLADSTSNYINITGVQLEVGSVATPFEHRSYGEELALCQRYYENSWYPNNNSSGSTWMAYSNQGVSTASWMSSPVYFKVMKRAAPTMTSYDNAGTSGKWTRTTWAVGADNGQNGGFTSTQLTGSVALSSSGTNRVTFAGNWQADAEL